MDIADINLRVATNKKSSTQVGGEGRPQSNKGKGKGKGEEKDDADWGQQQTRAKSYFGCRLHEDDPTLNNKNCAICKLQIDCPERFIDKKEKELDELLPSTGPHAAKTIPFKRLIQSLLGGDLATSTEIEGCEVQFPESLFFEDNGQKHFIAKTDKDGKLTAEYRPNKLRPQDLIRLFKDLYNTRNRKTGKASLDQATKQQDDKGAAGPAGNSALQADSVSLAQDSNTQAEAQAPAAADRKEKSPWFADCALVRYKKKGENEVKVLGEKLMRDEFESRKSDDYWSKVEVI